METKLTFVSDTTAALAAVKELTLELQRDLPGDVRQRTFEFLDATQLFCIQSNIDPADADQIVVRYQPAKRLLMLIAALRARKFFEILTDTFDHD
jgi:hypothetical protein